MHLHFRYSKHLESTFVGDFEKLKRSVGIHLRKKDLELFELRGKLSSCECEKASLSTKYRKYNDMALKLSNKSVNNDLEEENAGLRNKEQVEKCT